MTDNSPCNCKVNRSFKVVLKVTRSMSSITNMFFSWGNLGLPSHSISPIHFHSFPPLPTPWPKIISTLPSFSQSLLFVLIPSHYFLFVPSHSFLFPPTLFHFSPHCITFLPHEKNKTTWGTFDTSELLYEVSKCEWEVILRAGTSWVIPTPSFHMWVRPVGTSLGI